MKISIRNHRIYIAGKVVAFRQTPNGGKPLTPQGIIVHDTAGDLAGTGSVAWLTNPQAKASAHVVVGYDGTITQLQALNRQCWHAGASKYRGRSNCNAFTVGIEISNPGAMVKSPAGGYSNNAKAPTKGVRVAESMPVRRTSSPNHGLAYWLEYSDAQIEAVTALCRAIAETYAIEFIAPHWEICIPKGRKVDTNPLFPLEQLRADVLGAAGKPIGFADMSGRGDDGEFVPVLDPQNDFAPAIEPAPVHAIEAEAIQKRLRAMGYYEVGIANGDVGSRTMAAIAAFKFDRGLPGEAVIDAALRAALAEAEAEGFQRPIARERAEGVPEDSRIVKAAEKQGFFAWLLGALGLGGTAEWIGDKFESTRDILYMVKPYLKPFTYIIVEYWWLWLIAGGAFVLWQAAKAKAARLEDHRHGKTL